MFAASANGILLDRSSYGQTDHNRYCVSDIPFSIKNYEHSIASGKSTLAQVVDNIDWEYISTHLFKELPISRVNITVADSSVFDQVICRQMQLQQLRITKDSGTFYTIIKALHDKHQYTKAATVWFEFAKKHAQEKMQQRLAASGPKLDFSDLFKDTFVSTVRQQGWSVQLDVLETNHRVWLAKQPDFSKELSIYSIEQKLKSNQWAVLNAGA